MNMLACQLLQLFAEIWGCFWMYVGILSQSPKGVDFGGCTALHCIALHHNCLALCIGAESRHRYPDPGLLVEPCTLVRLCSRSRYTVQRCKLGISWSAGCCYGGQLTALIIPPQDDKPAAVLQSFIENAPQKESAADAGKGPAVDPFDTEHSVPSLSDMDASLILVPAKKAYSQKKCSAVVR